MSTTQEVSTSAPASPELLLEEAGPAHARWSELNREFLEFVARDSRYLSREPFASLNEVPWMRRFRIQPWPLFAGAEPYREVERTTLAMDRLLKDTLERFLRNDPARIVEYYRADETTDGWGSFYLNLDEETVAVLLEEPTGIRSAPSRGDYVEDARDGNLKCVEFNVGGSLGGVQAGTMGELYLAAPPIARFLREQERRARAPDTFRALYRHVVEDTARLGAWNGGDFNAAILIYPNDPARVALFPEELHTQDLCAVLAERGSTAGGTVVLCRSEDFVEDGGCITVAGRPIHAVLEMHTGSADVRLLFRHFKRGRINLYSGPIGGILSDKRNLALISENAHSDEYTSAERALIERHLPWTRRVLPGQTTTFRGRTLRLPDDLVDRREEFVLKKASSVGGRYVHVGKHRTDSEWRATLSWALQEGDWVVQEYLELVPYCFQGPDGGAVRHDVVWGLFAFGDHFGGAFLRMQPSSRGDGVVNTQQGAEVGTLLELTR